MHCILISRWTVINFWWTWSSKKTTLVHSSLVGKQRKWLFKWSQIFNFQRWLQINMSLIKIFWDSLWIKGDVFLHAWCWSCNICRWLTSHFIKIFESICLLWGKKKIGKFMDGLVLSGLEEWLVMRKHYRAGVAVMLRSVLNLILFSAVIRILFANIEEFPFIILCHPKGYWGPLHWLVIFAGST